MADLLSIWNLALSHLGNKAGLSSADAPYASREAELCGTYWPLARQFALTKVKPSWARLRAYGAVVDLGDEQPTQWLFTYAKPDNCLELVGVYEAEAVLDEERKPARVEAWSNGADTFDVIYTNTETAVLRWLEDVEDTSRYHPTFMIGVSWLLASYLAGPIIKGEAGMKVAEQFEKKAIAYLSLTETQDANQNQGADVFRDGNHSAPWLVARGFGGSAVLTDAPVLNDPE